MLFAFREPVTSIPEQHRAATVFTLGNRALEVTVVERMIFDLDGEPLVCGIEGGTPGNRPRLEYPIEIKSKVVVQPPGGMLLNDKAQTFGRGYRARTAGLSGFLEVALGAISAQFQVGNDTLP